MCQPTWKPQLRTVLGDHSPQTHLQLLMLQFKSGPKKHTLVHVSHIEQQEGKKENHKNKNTTSPILQITLITSIFWGGGGEGSFEIVLLRHTSPEFIGVHC